MQKVKKISINTVLLMMLLICITMISGSLSYVRAEAAVNSPSVTVQSKTLYVGYKAYTIGFNHLSHQASVIYQSENPKVVKVTQTGKILPVSAGSTDILATVKQNNNIYHLKVSVNVKSPKIILNQSADRLIKGEQYVYKAKTEGMEDKVRWSVSNPSVASIDQKGVVTAIKAGTVTILAKAGGKTAKSTLTVVNKKLTAEEIYKKCILATVEINSYSDDAQGLGSGFFIEDGIIVTNYHVIAGANKITVTTSNKNEYDVTHILGYDEKLDIAVLEINSTNKKISISKSTVQVGEDVYTIGSPLGLTGTMTKGMVSTASRKIDGVNYIQMDASISKGNSGGPLVNAYGEVVGINTMYYRYGNNLNFAININELKKVNTKNPISISSYYTKYKEDSEKEFLASMIHEDDVLSQDISTCQFIPADVGVDGKVTSSDDGDVYYFSMDEPGWFVINASLESSDDTKNLDIRVYDENYYLMSAATQYTDTYTEYLARYLTPGVYYIYLYREDNAPHNDIKYMFTTSKVYDSE